MEIKKASEYSINNMEELANSKLAGCYYCKSIFSTDEIKETIDEGKTALCPKCGIDSVLFNSSNFKINSETLVALNKYWF